MSWQNVLMFIVTLIGGGIMGFISGIISGWILWKDSGRS